jgi:hypothetical protein
MYECRDCKEMFCSACEELQYCEHCGEKNVCRDCGESDMCPNECFLCQSCKALGTCFTCKSQFCVGCEADFRQCILCSKRYCEKPACLDSTKQCAACLETFCTACKDFEHCIDCDTSFCKGHHRLLDCEACKISHCRPCGHDKCCTFCGAACYETCVCGDEKPTKKARLS